MNIRLEQAVAARAKAAADGAALDQQIARLTEVAQSTSPAVAELNALRNEASQAIQAWAETGEGEYPVADHRKIQALTESIQTHNAQVAGANAAISSLNAKRQAARKIEEDASRAARVMAIEETLADSLPILAHGINEIGAALAEKIAALDALFNMAISEAHRLDAKELFMVVERAREAQRSLIAKPEVVANPAPWLAHVAGMLAPVVNEESADA